MDAGPRLAPDPAEAPAAESPTRPLSEDAPPANAWRCSQCTFDNDDAASCCEVCQMPRLTPLNPLLSMSARSAQPSPLRLVSATSDLQLYRGALDDRETRRSRQSFFLAWLGALFGASLGIAIGVWFSFLQIGSSSQSIGSTITGSILLGFVGAALGPRCVPCLCFQRRAAASGRRPPARSPRFSAEAAELFRQMLEHEIADQATRPAQPTQIAFLPTHKLTHEEVDLAAPENKQCTICIEEFAAGDQQKTLPCFHRFHAACVDEWLRVRGTCPICKHRVDAPTPGVDDIA